MQTFAYLSLFAVAALAEPMMMSAAPAYNSYAPASAAPAMAGGMTHTVTVGGVIPAADATSSPKPMLQYTPDNIKASVGDTVHFVFMQANHTVTQSTFANPCVKMANGADSGFLPNPKGDAGITWDFKVPTMEPIWMYCKQKTGTHCGKGMVFAINAAETGDKTFSAYKQLAIQQNGTALTSAAIQQPGATAVASTVTIAASSAGVTTTATAAASSATIAAGMGSQQNGQCSCHCLCGSNSFPQGAGANSFGGWGGMMPAGSSY